MSSTRYRPDIDGLRSLAIIPVVLFHASIPGLSGGYVGVDVFFVISGYLITSILAREIAENRYSLASFYERRARRIFPALLAVFAFTLLASPLFLLPSELSRLPGQALASLFFVGNIAFWRGSGYFAADAETNPLLHMWSLGVEEQFYIFCPLFIFFLIRYLHRHLQLALMVAAGASLALCVWMTPFKPSAAFYLLPTRAWELLAGSLLATAPLSWGIGESKRGGIRSALATIGFAMIAFAVLCFDSDTQFPGYAAIVPVLGTSLLIACAPGTYVGAMLSSRILVSIGLVSYSLYLWHWPITVFARDMGALDSPVGKLAVVAISFALAYLSWKFIETPTRSRSNFSGKWLAFTSLFGSLAIVLIAVGLHYSNGWPSRYSSEVNSYDASRKDVSPLREKCHRDRGLPNPEKSCVIGGENARVAVWGDSHGVELAYAIAESGVPVRQLTYSACQPALGREAPPSVPDCARHNQEVYAHLIATPDIDTVVLVGFYKDSLRESDGLLSQMASTAKALSAQGKRVIAVGPTPYVDTHTNIPTHLARGGVREIPMRREESERFRRVMGSHAEIILPEDLFCGNGVCSLLIGGHPLLFDAHHPSLTAAKITGAKVAASIKEK